MTLHQIVIIQRVSIITPRLVLFFCFRSLDLPVEPIASNKSLSQDLQAGLYTLRREQRKHTCQSHLPAHLQPIQPLRVTLVSPFKIEPHWYPSDSLGVESLLPSKFYVNKVVEPHSHHDYRIQNSVRSLLTALKFASVSAYLSKHGISVYNFRFYLIKLLFLF